MKLTTEQKVLNDAAGSSLTRNASEEDAGYLYFLPMQPLRHKTLRGLCVTHGLEDVVGLTSVRWQASHEHAP